VQLVLLVDAAVAVEQVRDVVEALVLHREVRAADDVDVVLQGELREELQVLRRELGQPAHGQPGPFGLQERQQLRREELREQDEVGLVVGRHVDEVLALPRELVEAAHPPHLVLHRADAHAREATSRRFGSGW
jgi:hypothetical protein